MQIADLLIPHLTDLDRSEQLTLILAIRERRRLVLKAPRVTKITPQRNKKDPLASMTKEQLAKLLEALTNEQQ